MTAFILQTAPQQRHQTIRREGGVRVDGHDVPLHAPEPHHVVAQSPGGALRMRAVAQGDVVHVHLNGRSCAVERIDPTRSARARAGGGAEAPMPGVVVSWLVQPGATVQRGDALLVIESMKLQMTIAASQDGVLERLPFEAGQTFPRGALLAQIRADAAGAAAMSRIASQLDTASAAYRSNFAEMTRRVEDLRRRLHVARHERPERDLDRLRKQRKLTVRERLDLLLDPGTPFLEIGALVANKAYGGDVHGAGQVSGIGIIHGREVVIHADDPSIKGGAWYPLSVKKIVRTLDIAIENRLPVLHLCDSAGGFLPLQADLFPDRYTAGRIFRNQCTLSKLGVPQIAVVLGHCTAGGAYIPALCDYSVIVRGNGGVFLGGPPLVKAATGEVVTAEALGGADMHTTVSGTCDYAADDEPHAMAIARDIFAQTTPVLKQRIDRIEAEPPSYDPQELYGIVPTDWKVGFDMREVIARVVDGSHFHEYQPGYGTTIVCGYARIWGCKVGILANNGVLFNDSSLKAAHFMRLCDRDRTPLVFLQNITGYMVGREYEERGITKDGAKMIMTQVGCTVPKFTVVVGGSFGAGNYGMCGRAFDGRFLWMWPQSQIAVMGAEQAANTLAEVKVRQLERQGQQLTEAEVAAIRDPVLESFKAESDAYYSTSELWDDGILDPVDTRNALGMAIIASLNAPFEQPGYGVLRL